MKNLGAASFMIWFFLFHSENDLLDLLIYLYVREWNALCALFSGYSVCGMRFIDIYYCCFSSYGSLVHLFIWFLVCFPLKTSRFRKKKKKKRSTRKTRFYHLLNWEKKKTVLLNAFLLASPKWWVRTRTESEKVEKITLISRYLNL